jgi:Ca2+-binding RTX toxin-like protein
VVPDHVGHNELLGGHGSDTIHAGDSGDVIWGDYKPSGQPSTQTDRLNGGPGKDFIYASHGRNVIDTGSGRDVVHAHFGYGRISCGSAQAIVFLSHASRKRYALSGCRKISYKTLGY